MHTIKISYPSQGPVSTQQLLNIAYRIMNETPEPLLVQLLRVSESKVVNITLGRTAPGGRITEGITSEERTA